MAAAQALPSIGLIIASTRPTRFNDQVASFVLDALSPFTTGPSPTAQITTLDISTFNLPLLDEPAMPALITDPTKYVHAHTRAWSAAVQRHAAYVFVTPQYNWGYPAALKNAIDFLFHEWGGKAALIVSYGGHGGGKCAMQLRQVLEGTKMQIVERMPGLAFGDKAVVVKASRGEKLDLEGLWGAEKEGIRVAFEELLDLLAAKGANGVKA